MSQTTDLLARHSFVELDARGRVRTLIDDGSFRELIDPYERATFRPSGRSIVPAFEVPGV